MIHRAEFHNFKALRDVSVDLARFTLLVGPNASGKTSILEGIDYLLRAVSPDLKAVFSQDRHAASLRSMGATDACHLSCQGDGWSVSLTFETRSSNEVSESGPRTRRRVVDLRETIRERPVEDSFVIENGPTPVVVTRRVTGKIPHGSDGDGTAGFLRLNADSLIAASYSDEEIPRMKASGEGLPSLLTHLATNEREAYRWIHERLRELVPSVRGFVLPRAQVPRMLSEVAVLEGKSYKRVEEHTYWGNGLAFEIEGGGQIPGHLASEGTILLLGLLAALASRPRPSVVLLDDLDRALHPRAQADLVALLRKVMEENPALQIVATSHSPYLLDCLRPEEVRLTTLKQDGSVACARLDQHPEFEKWKDEMAPGEFWSMVGESWVAQVGSAETRQ